MALRDHLFAFGAHSHKILLRRSRASNAQIDKVPHANLSAGGRGLAGGNEIDRSQLGYFRSQGIWSSHQMNKSIGGANQLAVAVRIERITRDDLTVGGQLRFRAGPNEHAHSMVALGQNRNKITPDVS